MTWLGFGMQMRAATAENEELFHELAFYTLALGDAEFRHQHAVDAYAAQRASEESKPIGLVFGLAGLYLHLERGYTGKQVQRAHMAMAQRRKAWPRIALVAERGAVTIKDVLAAELGAARNAAIEAWCKSVWVAWSERHGEIQELVHDVLGVE